MTALPKRQFTLQEYSEIYLDIEFPELPQKLFVGSADILSAAVQAKR